MRLYTAVAAVVVLLLGGCAGRPQMRAEPEIDVRAVLEPQARAGGDVQQSLKNIQETLTRLEQNQQTQNDKVAEQIDRVENLNQNVEKHMYALDENRQQLEEKRMSYNNLQMAQMVGILTGVLLIFAAAPAVVGGPVALALWVAGIAVILVAAFFPALIPWLLA